MRGSLQAETEILTQCLALRDDPVGFIAYAIPWGRENTPFAELSGPRPWQLEELQRIGEHVRAQGDAAAADLPLTIWRSAYASGRGPGKSALFAMLALWHMSTHLGSTTTVAANTEGQLRSKTFPEMAKWFGASINAHWWGIETLRIVPATWLLDIVRRLPEEGGLGIEPKYWFTQGATWSEENPDAFAGTHNPYGVALMFDEAAGIVDGVWDVSEGFFTEVGPYRFWLAASQMRRRSGRMFELFDDAKVGKGWRTRILSTRGMEGIDQQLVKSQIERYGEDSDFVRVEIDGLPPRTSEDQFIPWELVRQAQANELYRDDGEPLILGVDPAPRGKTAWRFRQGRNARDCCGAATHGHWQGRDNVQIVDGIIDLVNRYQPDAVCIDFGMGTGVIDVAKRKPGLRHLIHEVRFGDTAHAGKESEFATHAIELWAKVRDWLPGGMIEKDSGEKGSLSQQLTDRGWRWSQREDNKKILETKEDLQSRGVKSPDDADALACTFEVNPPRRGVQGYKPKVLIADGVGTSAFFD